MPDWIRALWLAGMFCLFLARGVLATGRISVDPQAQAAKLVVKTPPEYPSFARGGHPALTDAAAEAVKQWVYQPTLLNGTQVEVTTEVDVDVGPPQ
jgi:hypothetical protein